MAITNVTVQGARAVDSTQVKAADRGLRVQWFVQVSRYRGRRSSALQPFLSSRALP